MPKCPECGNADQLTAIIRYVDLNLIRRNVEYIVTQWVNLEVIAVYCDNCNNGHSKLSDEDSEVIAEGIVAHFSLKPFAERYL